MTFKVEWEKTHTKHHLSDDMILQMLETFYDKTDIESFKIIEGGCANINILVSLKPPETSPFAILRIYLRDPTTAIKERKIYEILGGKLPIPETYHIEKLQEYIFAITRHLQGISLRDFLLRPGKKNIRKIMYNVGQALGKISQFSFEKSGFFDSSLQVTELMTRQKIITFCADCLSDEKVNFLLPKQRIEQIEKMFLHYKCSIA